MTVVPESRDAPVDASWSVHTDGGERKAEVISTGPPPLPMDEPVVNARKQVVDPAAASISMVKQLGTHPLLHPRTVRWIACMRLEVRRIVEPARLTHWIACTPRAVRVVNQARIRMHPACLVRVVIHLVPSLTGSARRHTGVR